MAEAMETGEVNRGGDVDVDEAEAETGETSFGGDDEETPLLILEETTNVDDNIDPMNTSGFVSGLDPDIVGESSRLGGLDPDIVGESSRPGGSVPDTKKDITAILNKITEDKKDLLAEEFGIELNKGDGKNATLLLNRMKITMDKKQKKTKWC